MLYIYHVLLTLSVFLKVSYSFNGAFWHICDIHLNASYNSNQDPYGNYIYDSSLPLVRSAITAMKTKLDNPDFIIWNGDNVDHKAMNNTLFFKTLRNVSEELRVQFPNTSILPTFGNHDINPSSHLTENSSWCDELFEYWKYFFNSTVEEDTFKKGCYYSRIVNLDNDTRKIIVLNTMIWYSSNKETKNLIDPLGQFKWLEMELRNATTYKQKVFIVAHIPPGASEYTPAKYKHLHPKFNKQLVDILQHYSDIIEAGFFSHQHTDSFKIVYSSKGKPVIPLFLSPSVTPFLIHNLGSVNPSIRLYRWPMNPAHRLYEQYHTTLPIKQSLLPLEWSREYNSSLILPSLSAKDMDVLLKIFTSVNSTSFDIFFRRHLSGRVHEHNETCPPLSQCRCWMICGMKHIGHSELDRCLAQCDRSIIQRLTSPVTPSPRSSQVPMIVSVIVVFTLLLIAIVVGVNKVYCHQRRSASLTRDIYLATYNGKNCEEIVEDHIDHIAEKTFGDVPEYRGHIRNNSRTILTLNDGNEIVNDAKSRSSVSKFTISKKDKPQEKYDYSRM